MPWIINDRYGNEIALTDERWQHITEGHWELENLLAQIIETIRLGTRKQFANDPNKYRYSKKYSDMPHRYTHLVVIVRIAPKRFIITAYPKRVR